MKGPKIVVIGAGSAIFGLANLGAIMRTESLKGATLALCDINAEGLEKIRKLAERINQEWGSEMRIETSTERCDLLPGADFVIISIAIDREKCWKSDFLLGQQFGIMHYAENGGPGGFFHAARNMAILMPIFKDIEQLAPEALVLNFSNPMTRICTAAARYTKLKMVGICHQLDHGYLMAARILGPALGMDTSRDYVFRWESGGDVAGKLVEAGHKRFNILASGINHFTWYKSIVDKETGEELLPLFKKLFLEQKEFEPYTRAILEAYGECPTSGDAHCLEYLPFTSNMERKTWERMDIQMYPLDIQDQARDDMWKEIEAMGSGEKSIDCLKHEHTERAELIAAAVWNDENYYDYAVNIPNTNGVIANMDRDAIVEVPAVMNKHGVLGIATGELSPIAATLCNRQKTIVDYAVKGMVEGDYQASLTALALDPMIDDLDIARKLLDEGLRINADYLPQFHQ